MRRILMGLLLLGTLLLSAGCGGIRVCTMQMA